MAKTLSFTDTSPQTVKIGDTTTSFTLVCGNDNVATDLTNVTSITVKLGNSSGYLKSATVDPASLTDPTTGQVTVKFNADLMTSLPAGSYAIEVWVVDSTGTSIYPSDGSTGFAITNNIQSANGSTITTITFDDFVKAMNKAASTIAKGDKGDTGTVDNAGLTTAPAFVELKTQVDNSAVGINLALGTSTQVVQASDWNLQVADINYDKSLGDNLCASVMINNADHASALVRGSARIVLKTHDKSGKTLASVDGDDISYNANGLSQRSINIDDNTANVKVYIWTNNMSQNAFYSCLKIEKGTKATPWCPNPSEILTQSDYAKIQAAIVALGGSLK
ncbi:collagen-like protein [Lactiplantibacillus pentosus]|uniref:collagen-like protein n=1 Tax=Lactiplantibacillus pentosus TaxID=1589 RepID=UPI0021A8FAA4|nr:collagen-like protein [Lactiplantibacillus pentosus]MCT3309935.1 collagen-like protein [Lactiplantibacillus pentosus]